MDSVPKLNTGLEPWHLSNKGYHQVVDILSRLLEKVKEASVIKGLFSGKNKVEVTHLQLADDTIFFLKTESENVGWLSKIIQLFCSMS